MRPPAPRSTATTRLPCCPGSPTGSRSASADPDPGESGAAQDVAVEQVAGVDHDGGGGYSGHGGPVEGPELGPFGEDHECVGLLRHGEGVVDDGDVVGGPGHPDLVGWIVAGEFGAFSAE